MNEHLFQAAWQRNTDKQTHKTQTGRTDRIHSAYTELD